MESLLRTPPDLPLAVAPQSAAIKTVALFEAFKGVVVLAAATGLLSLVHRDVYGLASHFIAHLHLNPAAHYPQIFLDAAAGLHDSRLLLLAAGAGVYALLRFMEAWGLYGGKAWAEVLAAASGAVYVPFEVAGLVRRATWHGGLFLSINLLVVGLMLAALRRRRKQARGPSTRGTSGNHKKIGLQPPPAKRGQLSKTERS